MVTVESLIFNKLPVGVPVPGETLKKVTSELDLDSAPLNGGVLVKTHVLDLSPYMRGRMRDPSIPSYSPAFPLGHPLVSHAVVTVLRSDSPAFAPGDVLYGRGPHSTHAVLPADALADWTRLDNAAGLELHTYVGAAGMPGQTAHFGLTLGRPRKGETIFVSAASGAVGQVVVQLAKQQGLKVIGSAGDDKKVAYIREIGADVAWNYKTEDTAKFLDEHPIDIFFDNVGGETLDLVLSKINTFGRIIACGSVSQYNLAPDERYGVKNTFQVVAKQLSWTGFIVGSAPKEVTEDFYKTVPFQIKRGEIKIREHVTKGLDNGEAFVDMLTGRAQGKAVIVLE